MVVCESQGHEYSLVEHLARSIYFGDDWAQLKMVMLSAYFDRSEYTEDHATLVVAGYISEVEAWKSFDSEWKHFLALPEYSVPYFHMKEFTVSRGVFSNGWKGQHRKRREFLEGLIRIVQRHTFASFATGVRLDEFNAVLQEFPDIHPQCPIRSPFAYCGWLCVRKAEDHALRERFSNPRVQSYFEKGDKDRHFLEDILDHFKHPTPQFKPKIPEYPEQEADCLRPLQCADFAAWEVVKYSRSVDANPNMDWDDVRESFKQLNKYPPAYWGLVEPDAIRDHVQSMLTYQCA
ncbi:MAG: hypothetical protein ABSH52_24970 [Terriglobia bacterium]